MRTVLVIEDNPTMLRGLQDNFELKGYRVKTALDGEQGLNTVWGYSRFVSLRDVDRFVATLRNKIEPDPNNPRFIHTIKDIGYKFELPELNGNNTNN